MSDNIPITGGLGGVGEGGELKPLRGLSDVGKAEDTDVLKFQKGLSGNLSISSDFSTGQIQFDDRNRISMEIKGNPGPFDFQTTRLTSVPQKPSLGEIAVKETEKLLSVGRNQEQDIIMKIQGSGKEAMSTRTMLEVQYKLGVMTVLWDTVSKAVGKLVTGLQTIARQQ